ncbi:MAG: ribosomal protein S18-alanine N-acetyltransferase [Desulfurobacteriaceae bacterium]
MQDLLVRECREEDIGDILKIERESFSDCWSKETLEKELSLPFSYFLVAEVNKEVVGYLISWIIDEVCELNRIAVSKRFRGKGIGKKLITSLINFCFEKSVKGILLEVRESNFAAIRFYESFGFKKISTRKNYYGNETALIYKLFLGGRHVKG